MKRLLSLRSLFILVPLLLLIGVMVPIATMAKSSSHGLHGHFTQSQMNSIGMAIQKVTPSRQQMISMAKAARKVRPSTSQAQVTSGTSNDQTSQAQVTSGTSNDQLSCPWYSIPKYADQTYLIVQNVANPSFMAAFQEFSLYGLQDQQVFVRQSTDTGQTFTSPTPFPVPGPFNNILFSYPSPVYLANAIPFAQICSDWQVSEYEFVNGRWSWFLVPPAFTS